MAELPVLIAHDSAEMAAEIELALREITGRLTLVRTGEEALSHLVREHPRVLVVDVALPGRAPFELCDDIRQAGLRTRVVLVASVYNRTRYKRRPTSLYGADDYVEQHHIHDMLPEKVKRLLSGEGSSLDVPHGQVDPVVAARVREVADAMMTIQFDSEDEGRARAERLCNLIVADVVLYNGEAFETMRDLGDAPARLLDDLQEAREIFAKLVPREIRGDSDWIGDQLAELLERRPQEQVPLERSSDGF
ncbi:MAG: response regulator [bacterium]